ncbi:cation:proton antiporter [Demequina aurantiaca]|uniref:cation:proton antiporter n=1 Tax=Demequina aurantiaca TaxID=676200 RepID=UPI003D3397A0
MDIAVIAILGVIGIVAVNAVAPRVGVASPLILVALGVMVSLVPGVPELEFPPELILAGVLPPLLYSAAVSVPTLEFRRDFTVITGMSVVLVVAGSVLMGLFFFWAIEDIPLPIGIALGAIVSPTDAVATNIIRHMGVPPRVVTVLEGESMLNDPSALVLLRATIAAAAVSVSVWTVAWDFATSVLVAVVVGAIVGLLALKLRKALANSTSGTAISFVLPFIAYVPAEALGASGLVAAVTAGLMTSALSARYLRPRDRMSETQNWRTIELLLEGGVFLIMGLQLTAIITQVQIRNGSVWFAVGIGAVAAALILVIRSIYVSLVLVVERRKRSRAVAVRERLEGFAELTHGMQDRKRARIVKRRVRRRVADVDYITDKPLGRREGVVLVWAGMRGAVTLAASQTLPADTPARSTLILIAFVVSAGSLLVQGGSLPWVVRWLGLAKENTDVAEVRESALVDAMSDAAFGMLDNEDLRRPDGTEYDPRVVTWIRDSLAHERTEDDHEAEPILGAQLRELRLAVIDTQRRKLLRLHAMGEYSTDALRHVLAVLDADQISAELKDQSD